jgi:F-type H+-transporting ATPase subunit delta
LKSASWQYAHALADIALAQGAADPAGKQLVDFVAVYEASSELRTTLASPAVPLEAKHAVIDKIAARTGASRIIRNFLFVVTDHHRTALLPDIAQAFQQVVRQRQGIAEAQISSAAPLTERQKEEFAVKLQHLTGKKVETKYDVDAGLIGGAVVRIGDTIYDGSLRSRLDNLRAHLAAE